MSPFVLRLRDTAAADALFSEAYAAIDQGLCYEEYNDRENAASMYERGLNLITEAEKAKNAKRSDLYKHLMEAKPSVANRLKVLEKEIALYGAWFSRTRFYTLVLLKGENTTAPTYPTSLQVLQFSTPDSTPEKAVSDEGSKPSALIQVGPWVYPLVRGQTPVLRNDFGAYVVSNPTQENPGLAVAILLPSDIGPEVEQEFREFSVLSKFCDLRDQDVRKEFSEDENKLISRKIAQLLIAGGERIAWGVETTAVKVTSYLDDKAERYRSGIEPAEKPVSINPALKGSLLYMHKGSKLVAKCTRYLLDKVGDMGVSIGRSLASGAEKTFGKGSAAGVVSGTISVLGGGITGVSTVWMSLEDNSRSLCRSIANQTVQTVKLKYGDEASEATHHALFAAGHGSLAAAQLWDLGPRSIAGRMARRAGVQMVKDLHEVRIGESLPIKTKPKDL
ncbi:hypothetical protein NECAME_00250 [Necator americanus]|uniref:Senescence domain-containing protein n=1 Tax=Necator americanus TaxID=51031 RepID=W2TJU5_NECAM|nr:hypothetical protein NECAME_00250 [Necator americanus]ETN81899.1 hypothetical protein NECAME_00250 [Necator americanus]